MTVRARRVYEAPDPADGRRVLEHSEAADLAERLRQG